MRSITVLAGLSVSLSFPLARLSEAEAGRHTFPLDQLNHKAHQPKPRSLQRETVAYGLASNWRRPNFPSGQSPIHASALAIS